MAFVQRIIQIAIKLAPNPQLNQPGTFAGTALNTVTLPPLRTRVRITNSGAPARSRASVSIYGLSSSLINQLATLGMVFNVVPKNELTITAGDVNSGLSPVFSGTITQAYADYSAQPNVPMHFECNTLLGESVAPAPVSSFPKPTDVATIMAGFARQLNKIFENNGITAQLPPSYYSGSIVEQMQACASDANINAEIIGGITLAIWPKGQTRTGGVVPLIAPPPLGGMIGYPTYTPNGIIVKTVFDPRISFGSSVKVQSSLQPISAVSQWAVGGLDLDLDSQVYGGEWSSTLACWNPKYPQPILKTS